MKKLIFFLTVLIVILIGITLFKNYIIIDGKIEKVFYPKQGVVLSETDAIDLCCFYFNNMLDEKIIHPDMLDVKYDKRLKAWIVKQKGDDFKEGIVDGNLRMAIRKKDGKILMFSMY